MSISFYFLPHLTSAIIPWSLTDFNDLIKEEQSHSIMLPHPYSTFEMICSAESAVLVFCYTHCLWRLKMNFLHMYVMFSWCPSLKARFVLLIFPTWALDLCSCSRITLSILAFSLFNILLLWPDSLTKQVLASVPCTFHSWIEYFVRSSKLETLFYNIILL